MFVFKFICFNIEAIRLTYIVIIIRRIGSIKKADEVIGNETRVKVVKNKVSPPFKIAEFDILYGRGISREGELIDMGVKHNIVDKSGAWYSYGSDRIGQGRDNVREFLANNPEMAAEIEGKIRDLILGKIDSKTESQGKDIVSEPQEAPL